MIIYEHLLHQKHCLAVIPYSSYECLAFTNSIFNGVSQGT
jgi:hypothetical protein